MSGFICALRSELYRSTRSRAVHVMLLLAALAAAGRIVLGRLQSLQKSLEGVATGASPAATEAVAAYGPFVDGVDAGLTVGILLLTAITAASLAGDKDLGVVRLLLTRRVSRTALVVAKFGRASVLALVLVAVVFCAAWGTAAWLFDFGAVVEEDGFVLVTEEEIRTEIVKGFAAIVLPLLALVAFALMVSACAGSAAAAISIALLGSLTFDFFKEFLGKGARFVFASFLPTPVDTSYLGEVVGKLAHGYSDAFFGNDEMWLNYLVPPPQALLFLGVTLAIAARRKM